MTEADKQQAALIADELKPGKLFNRYLYEAIALRAIENVRRSELTFENLANANRDRVPVFGHTIDEWSPTDWATAMAGEAGEACNFIKKLRRGDRIDVSSIGRELADVVIYADLLAQRLGISLAEFVRLKFNEVSEKRGSSYFI